MADYVFETKLDDLLGQACLVLKLHGEELAARILVNSKPEIRCGVTYDGYGNGYTGHALSLKIPFDLYARVEASKGTLETKIKDLVNSIARGVVEGEGLDSVGILIDMDLVGDWRKRSGLLKIGDVMPVTDDALARIWKKDCSLRVLISHKDEDKEAAVRMSDALYRLGISGFVAHRDIINSTIWPEELANALNSMDACVALLTKYFHGSFWTDQEVGWAFGRGVKVIPLNFGETSYGFMGNIQANPIQLISAARHVFSSLRDQLGWVDALIYAVERCPNFDTANGFIWDALQSIEKLSAQQVGALVTASNSNPQIVYSASFANGGRDGIPFCAFLKKVSGRDFHFDGHQWVAAPQQEKSDDGMPF